MHRRIVLGGMLAAAASTVALCRPRTAAQGVNYVTPESFGATGDGVSDDGAAFRRACRHCAATGDHLRLSRRRYRGARLEVHGSFDVIGEGATVDYLGIGNTLIEGRGQSNHAIPTPWPPTDLDAYAELFPVRGGLLARPAADGDTMIVLDRPAAALPGDWLFLAQRPTTMSSGGRPGNYIPSDFGFVQVKQVSGTRIALTEPLPLAFDAGTAAFASAGTAVGCRIADLTIATSTDAYQHVLRSGIDIVLDRITFAGESAVGACTFANRITYRDCRVIGAYGPLSVARGCDNVLIDSLAFATRRGKPTAEPFGIFIEESFGEVVIRRVEGDGAGFSIRSTDLGGAARQGRVLLDRCRFDTSNAVEGQTSPFQGGVAIGVAIDVTGCAFRGASVNADSGLFPGVGKALTWMASIGRNDHLAFSDCHFDSVNGGVAMAVGGGFQGKLILDPRTNRFTNCQPPRL